MWVSGANRGTIREKIEDTTIKNGSSIYYRQNRFYIPGIASSGQVIISSDKNTRSASFPVSIDPFIFSSNDA